MCAPAVAFLLESRGPQDSARPAGPGGISMRRIVLGLMGFGILGAVWAASYIPPGTKPGDFVAYPGPVTALTGATLIDGTGAPPQHGMTLLIEDGRIAALG